VTDWKALRKNMVDLQIAARGVNDTRVLDTMREVPRHLFVGRGMEASAYGDHALPIGEEQTISQPYMVAIMTVALRLTGEEKILEIGTGSGYQTALLSRLADRVFSVERIETLATRARETLDTLGLTNISILVGDGTIGWKEFAPYDRILVTAGSPAVPTSLLEQLADPGILVIPVGPRTMQQLRIVEKRDGVIEEHDEGGCAFVPLVGKDGWELPTG
jgi:protein-L-isoaspartate(D-aspartate) O-methyltransferase